MNRIREMLESTPAGRRKLREARMRRDDLFAEYEQGYAAALWDAARLVRKTFEDHPLEFPSDHAATLAAAIEALGSER